MPHTDLSRIVRMMKGRGVQRLLVKQLAPNDNSKNQVYLGPSFAAVAFFPTQSVTRVGTDRFYAHLNFSWIDDVGRIELAPDAKLILYPQYPEVRLSGFLQRCSNPPSDLMNSREEGRVLFIGVTKDQKLIAHVVATNSAAARHYVTLNVQLTAGIFGELILDPESVIAGDEKRDRVLTSDEVRDRILMSLGTIHRKGWIAGKRLNSAGFTVSPYNARNAGGLTLEAELGVLPNSESKPDYLGWELKQYKVNKFSNVEVGQITMIEPEPTGGFYKEEGAEAFIHRFGHPDKEGRPDRLNFSGRTYVGKANAGHGLRLELVGYDNRVKKITDGRGYIGLLTSSGEEAALWHFEGLIEHWNKKHARCVFVPSLLKKTDRGRMYHYCDKVRMGEGTDIQLFLSALANEQLCYDPGSKLENISNKPRVKKRNPFRIHPRHLHQLYTKFDEWSVI